MPLLRMLLIAMLAMTMAGGAAPKADAAVRAVQIGDFDAPTYVAIAPGARRLLFVVEQGGTIRVLRNGRVLRRPFLDISDLVSAGGERGLLSVAFAPNYERSRRLYVYFTNADGDIEVDEFRRSLRRPAQARRGSRRPLLTIRHRDAANHNGGQLQFGPDGFLYIGTGDGGGAGDVFDNARHKTSLLGKLLRIDPRPGERRPYRIPAGNPYVDSAGRDEIYSYGLRNPWRFSFRGSTLAIGDVGQNLVEEVNVLPLGQARGANFGWPEYEGSNVHDPTRPGDEQPLFPMHEYSHAGGNCSVTGGYIVRDRHLPALRGRYLYVDFCKGELRSFDPDIDSNKANDDRPLGITLSQVSSFGEGRGGRIYVTSLEGPVYRLREE